jgi:hypothetical protein
LRDEYTRTIEPARALAAVHAPRCDARIEPARILAAETVTLERKLKAESLPGQWFGVASMRTGAILCA